MTETPRPMTRAVFGKLTGLTDLTCRSGGYELLLQQIVEHAWYLGQRGQTVELIAAAADWYDQVFRPAWQVIEATGLPRRLHNAGSGTCYLAVCEHKWYLSEQAGYDVGFAVATTGLLNSLSQRAGRIQQVA